MAKIDFKSNWKRTHRDVVGSIHEDVEDGPDDQIEPKSETASTFFLNASPIFQINPVVRKVKVEAESADESEIGLQANTKRSKVKDLQC